MGPIVKLICGQLLRPHKHKHILRCECSEVINDAHARSCMVFQTKISQETEIPTNQVNLILNKQTDYKQSLNKRIRSRYIMPLLKHEASML